MCFLVSGYCRYQQRRGSTNFPGVRLWSRRGFVQGISKLIRRYDSNGSLLVGSFQSNFSKFSCLV